MKKIIMVLLILSLITIVILINLEEEQAITKKNGFRIYTSIYPVYETAREIAGNNIELSLTVPNGTEIHGYEPSPKRIAELEEADLFFYIGIGMEPWVDKAKMILENSGVRTIELSNFLDLIKLENNHTGFHDVHSTSYDPHVWLDPDNMKKIAEVIKDELISLDSENRDIYLANYNKFARKIQLLNKEYQEALSEKKQDKIIVSHAAFGYLAKKYNFTQMAITGLTSHEESTPGSIAELINIARKNDLNYVFLESTSDKRVVQVLAQEAGLEILHLDPFIGLTEEDLGNGEDYFSIMRKNLNNLEKALVK